MARLDWNEENLPTLGKVFLRKVMANFRDRKGAEVRFGITGTGVKPNYQVIYPRTEQNPQRAIKDMDDAEIVTIAYSGTTHSPYPDTEGFHEERISGNFSYEQIEQAHGG